VAKNQSTSFYGNIVSLAESPKQENLIYVGTDDGLVQVSADSGATWTKYDKFPGVPETTYVSRLAGSSHDPNTVYAAFDNHKNEDFRPYLLKSTDRGKTWTSIAGDLPENGPVLAFAEDPVNPNLFFAGTEFGAFFSIDGGGKWLRLKGGLPTIAVRDMVIQARENDLVLATFGRGFYVLDNLTPLRQIKPDTLQQPATFFPTRDVLIYIERHPLGGQRKAFQGDAFYTADNPAFGATFTYYFKDKLKSRKETRQDAEKDAAKKNQSLPYPTTDQLRAEAEELKPEAYLTVYDESGAPIRRVDASVEEGFHRVTWDLRYPTPSETEEQHPGEEFMPATGQGPLVLPGKYAARLFKKVDGVVTELSGPQNFNVVSDGTSGIAPSDRAAQEAFQRKVARLYRAVSGAINSANEVQARLKAMRKALQDTPSAEALTAAADLIEKRSHEILRALRGDTALAARNENVPASINDRVTNIMEGERFVITAPTQTHQEAYTIAADEFAQQLTNLHALIQVDLAKLEKDMEAAGAPWTPGRVPQWQENRN